VCKTDKLKVINGIFSQSADGNAHAMLKVHIRRDLGVAVTVRVPTIPGCNDSDENIAATARFAASLGGDVAVHLLPYHRLGESKNLSLGRPADLGIVPPDDAHMQHLKEVAEQYVSCVRIGG